MSNPTVPFHFPRIVSLLCLCAVALISRGQNVKFDIIPSPPPSPQIVADIHPVDNSSVVFGDVDGDNDEDVLITGSSFFGRVSMLYLNDGLGNYQLKNNTPFRAAQYSSCAFADIDGDNDLDLLITGVGDNNILADLFTNDGSGNFTRQTGHSISPVSNGAIAFADIDSDNDLDLLVTGLSGTGSASTKLYTNDGTGVFSSVTSSLDDVGYSAVAFADVDGDNDLDLFIAGSPSLNNRISKLYKNDGSGSFTLVSPGPFTKVDRSAVAFEDIDGDSDKDLILSGMSAQGRHVSVYKNGGTGNYSLFTSANLNSAINGSLDFADVDNDNDKDLVITWINSSNGIFSKLFLNSGNGSFNLSSSNTMIGSTSGAMAFADVDGDLDMDILITGNLNSKLYLNDGSGNFSVVELPLLPVHQGAVAFADIDGDNDEDLLISGARYNPSSYLYLNNGNGDFSSSTASLTAIKEGAVAFADIDGDNDQDLLLTGTTPSVTQISQLFTNDGSGNFSLVPGTPFSPVKESSVIFGDIDSDSDMDLLITGLSSGSTPVTELFFNDGSGNFSLAPSTPFHAVRHSATAFADVDNDGDLDVLITGEAAPPINENSSLYLNDGNGNFSLSQTSSALENVHRGAIAFGDLNGDGSLDLAISGQNSFSLNSSRIYTNDGSGNFSMVSNFALENVDNGSIDLADVDGDSDLDLIISGRGDDTNVPFNLLAKTVLYQNNGNAQFFPVSNMPFDSVQSSALLFNDIDSDGDPDLLITGNTTHNVLSAKLYRNSSCANYYTQTVSTCPSHTWIDSITYYASDSLAARIVFNTSSGCDSVVSLNLTIDEIDTTISQSGKFLVSNEANAIYQWYDCSNGFNPINGEINQNFEPVQNGKYAVVIDKYNCSDTSICYELSNIHLKEHQLLDNLSIYPNPSHSSIKLVGPKTHNSESILLRLKDSKAKIVLEQNMEFSEAIELNLNFPPGLYFLEVHLSDGQKRSYKLIKAQ